MKHALALLLVVSVLQGGCAFYSSKNMGSIEVMDGCFLKVKGISGVEANNIVKTLEFNSDCEAEVRSSAIKTAPRKATEMNSADHEDEQ